jgi:hypothetical protein
MESLAKAILQKFEKSVESLGNHGDFFFKLPVKTICGIKVCAELKFFRGNSQIHDVRFDIESYDISVHDSDDSPSIFCRCLLKDLKVPTLTLEQIISSIEQILVIIPTLKFNKKKLELTDAEILGDDVDELFKFENTTIHDVCSVCHELTNTRTDCDHALCLVCMSSIKGYYEEGEHIRKCPLCRNDITMLHH